jgi:hypothetical protein
MSDLRVRGKIVARETWRMRGIDSNQTLDEIEALQDDLTAAHRRLAELEAERDAAFIAQRVRTSVAQEAMRALQATRGALEAALEAIRDQYECAFFGSYRDCFEAVDDAEYDGPCATCIARRALATLDSGTPPPPRDNSGTGAVPAPPAAPPPKRFLCVNQFGCQRDPICSDVCADWRPTSTEEPTR